MFRYALTAEEAKGWEWWAEQKACTGYDGARSREFPVELEDFIACGGIAAGGCLFGDRIEVLRDPRYFEPALTHEYIHYAMRMMWMGDDWGHTHPLWARCDTRNRGTGVGEMIYASCGRNR